MFIHPGGLGDVILAYGAMNSVWEHFKPAEVHFAANPAPREVFRHLFSPLPIESADFGSLFSDADSLSESFRALLASTDLVISWLGGNNESFSKNINRLCRGEVIFGEVAKKGHSGSHASEVYLDVLDKVDIPRPERVPTMSPPLSAVEQGEKILESLGIPGTKPIICHPGSGGVEKCWPLDKFLRLAKWLGQGSQNPAVFIFGQAEVERGLHKELPPGHRAVIEPSVQELMGLLHLSSYYMGNDSGVTHLAGITGCKGMAVFINTGPAVWKPISEDIQCFKAFRLKTPNH